MKILVLNCGSSSIKYQLFNMNGEVVLAKGVVEKVGLQGSFMKHETESGQKIKFKGEVLDHKIGIEYVLGVLTSEKYGCIKKLEEIDAIGHRVAHGGEIFKQSVVIDDEAIAGIEKCAELAPLHNPAHLKGIFAMKELLPDVKQAAVFDTSFHQSMPKSSYMYGIPHSLYKKYAIRRYGFHGTSHNFVARRACEILGKDINDQKIITCHLGNGASLCAIKNGKSIDTSMGFTPVEGLIMGTRCGDVDPSALTFIMDKEKISYEEANTLINKHSGLLGVSGVSSDMREVYEAADKGNKRAKLALDMFWYRIRKYIGSYAAAMGGVDTVIFTGGIGENHPATRLNVCEGLDYMGIGVVFEKNDELRGVEEILSAEGAPVTVMVIPTNEELVIARDTENLAK